MFSLLSPLVTVAVIKRENSPILPPPPSIALYIPLVQLLHLTSPNPASTLACSRDLCSLLVFTLKSYLFFEIISSPLIGRCINWLWFHDTQSKSNTGNSTTFSLCERQRKWL